MQYWRTLYKYFRGQGFPHTLLATMCISPEEASQITQVIEKKRPRKILEVGTFIGLSTGVIALASMPDSTLVCVDPNLPVNLFSKQFNHFENRGTLVFVRKMLEHFGKEQKTIVLEGYFTFLSSQMREKLISLNGDPEKINIIGESIGDLGPYDLVFIDGDHQADAVYSDLCLTHRHLSQNGVVVLHDLSMKWGEEVYAGASKFIQEHPDFSLEVDNNLGFVSRDSEKSWLVKQKKRHPLVEKLERRILTMTL